MKKIFRIAKYVLISVLFLIILDSARLVYIAKTRLPKLDGEVIHQTLRSEVKVTRDKWGVPHIEAQSETDAYFALGYCMGQDRLFQMEALRRASAGELSEVLGPLAIPIDKIIRSFRFRATVEDALTKDECISREAREALNAFVEGVNHRIEAEPLPFEYAALHMQARPFTAADCVCVAGALGISFAEGLRTDPIFSLLQDRFPKMDVAALFPGYSKETPVTIMETLQEATDYLKNNPQAASGPQVSTKETRTPEEDAAFHEFVLAASKLTEMFGPTIGSNSWVLSGNRSKSGKPLLANDPHITFTNPGIWYEAHIKYPGFDLYGFYFPPLPFALLGQNQEHAWALTMFENDDLDLYREKFKPDNPLKVMYKGEWVDVREETETIKVRFWPDQVCKIRMTPHGSVVTDMFRKLYKRDDIDVALSWVWQNVPFTNLEGIYRMGRAASVEAFDKALSLVTSPGVNVSYADARGNIAWWAAGKVVLRPENVNHKAMLDGASGHDEILGYLPWEKNPHLINPPSGCIVTANNQPTFKQQEVQGYWQATDRAGRIEQLLDSREKWSLDELQAVQFDDASWSAPTFIHTLLKILDPARNQLPAQEQAVLAELEKWNYLHDVDSIGATIFETFRNELLRDVVGDELGPDLLSIYYTIADHWNFLKSAIDNDSLPFWDNIDTPDVKETRLDIVKKALTDVTAALTKYFGSDIAKWRWGQAHSIEFTHPFGYIPGLSKIFNIGPFEASGCGDTINSMRYHGNVLPYHVVSGPSTRRLIDYAQPDHQFSVLPTGNSGNFMSENYADQCGLFMNGKHREIALTDEQIVSQKKHSLHFLPMMETIYLNK